MKEATINQFLTEEQIQQASDYVLMGDAGNAVNAIETDIIRPNMAEIDRRLHQKNDPRYIAYAVYWVLSQLRKDTNAEEHR
jgi:hypothetical protein